MRLYLCLLMIGVLLLSACGEESPISTSTNTAAPPTVVERTVTDVPSAPIASTNTVVSIPARPTFQLTAILATPGELDREWADTAAFQEQRSALVDSFAPWIEDERVVAAMRVVPRHSFIPTRLLDEAYNDYPLPIGYGQTISQPSLVAKMTEYLQIDPGDRVLEIGTGSGYQAAILAELTDEVYTVEIIPELANTARAVLDRLGYSYVHLDRRDGYYGWNEYAPFDAIIVTAAPDHLPRPLVEQLNPDGGRMVIPIGPVGDVQMLWLVTRNGDEVEMEQLLSVRFVPFTRED